MSHVAVVSYFLGLVFGLLAFVVYTNYTLVHFILFLVFGFIIFELYKKFYAGEPDFIMHLDKEDVEDGDEFSKIINEIFENQNGEDD